MEDLRFDGLEYFKLERKHYEGARDNLSPAQYDKLMGAMASYFFDGKEPDRLPAPAKLYFAGIKNQIDYKRGQAINALGRRDGREEVSESSFEDISEVSDKSFVSSFREPEKKLRAEMPSACCDVIEAVQSPLANSNGNDKKGTRARAGSGDDSRESGSMHAPTLDEVIAYCRHCDLIVPPERFFDYYSANGWCDTNGRPIRDWRSKLHAWNRREGRFPEKAQSADAGNGGGGRRRLNISCVTSTRGGDKNEGAWFIQEPSEHAGLIPGSKGMSRDEAIRLAIELHPDLSDAVGK